MQLQVRHYIFEIEILLRTQQLLKMTNNANNVALLESY